MKVFIITTFFVFLFTSPGYAKPNLKKNYLGSCLDMELKQCQDNYLFESSKYNKVEFAKISKNQCLYGKGKWTLTTCSLKGMAYSCVSQDDDVYDKTVSYETEPSLIRAGKLGCRSVGNTVLE